MKLFYKKNTKLINRILLGVFLIANIFIAKSYFSQGQYAKSFQNLKTLHFSTKRLISKNLQSKCDILKNVNESTKIADLLKTHGVTHDLVSKKVLSINDLNFSQVLFKTYLTDEQTVEYISTGYLVTNTLSKSCYGLI